ncbi:hypothetical protein ZIOFF_025150 [Zingiber officinale]|uniref:Uncharacterized protein n=1 Tax=Zingiber officinale TaxID=94328 RepID=A0A8J5GVG5_ZINOF|nr:hypothetical protein ZIOFF_025150 [Zingiber officinale]
MGRGTGKGKKLTLSSYNEDPKSGGEELLPAYKRKNRPQKPLNDDIDEDAEQTEEGEDDLKLSALNEEVKVLTMVNGKKRKLLSKAKEIPELLETENGSGSKTKEHSTCSNSFRRIGSRRKSKPRRAAEAGVNQKGHFARRDIEGKKIRRLSELTNHKSSPGCPLLT